MIIANHPALRRPVSAASALALIDEFLTPSRPSQARTMPVSFYESSTAYLVRAVLPGFSKEQVSIDVEGDTLIIKARREAKAEPEGMSFIAGTALAVEVSRSVVLPEKVDTEGAKAAFTDGVLELTLPKQVPSRRAVPIH